jgi:hypothetical protein
VGGLETLKTHAFCVNCNYEEIYSDELCAIPQWALDAVKEASKPKKQAKKTVATSSAVVPMACANGVKPDGSAA